MVASTALAGASILSAGASSKAAAKSAIAGSKSYQAKAKATELRAEQAKLQAKADAVISQEYYNDTAAVQMVMGVASGRVVGGGGGSVDAIMNEDMTRFRWDELWNTNTAQIEQAAFYSDVYQLQLSAGETLKAADRAANVSMFNSILGAGRMMVPAGQ